MADKKRGKWVVRILVLRIFGRMAISAWSKERYALAERYWIKVGQHMNQVGRLPEICAALAKLDDASGSEEIAPYLSRLAVLLHEPVSIEDIPTLCEESRTMLFPFEAFNARDLGERFGGGPEAEVFKAQDLAVRTADDECDLVVFPREREFLDPWSGGEAMDAVIAA